MRSNGEAYVAEPSTGSFGRATARFAISSTLCRGGMPQGQWPGAVRGLVTGGAGDGVLFALPAGSRAAPIGKRRFQDRPEDPTQAAGGLPLR